MGLGSILLLCMTIVYVSVGTGTAIKHHERMRLRHIPYFLLVVPLRLIYALWAIAPLFAGLIGYMRLEQKENGRGRQKVIMHMHYALNCDEVVRSWLNTL